MTVDTLLIVIALVLAIASLLGVTIERINLLAVAVILICIAALF